MALAAKGVAGEVRAGGRVAAELGTWSFEGSSENWTVQAAANNVDAYILEYPTAKELRLHLKDRTWRFRNVTVSGGEGAVVISGTGRPETIDKE